MACRAAWAWVCHRSSRRARLSRPEMPRPTRLYTLHHPQLTRSFVGWQMGGMGMPQQQQMGGMGMMPQQMGGMGMGGGSMGMGGAPGPMPTPAAEPAKPDPFASLMG